MTNIRDNLLRVNERIVQAAKSTSRDPGQIRLIVVTKGHTIAVVESAIKAGANILGENYVEEAVPKIEALSDYSSIEWHMIGHIQSRKARAVAENFLWVHSVDSVKLAKRLDRFAGEIRRKLSILLEFNISGESSKFGFPAWRIASWDQLIDEMAPILNFPNLNIRGLMTMAPYFPDPEEARPYYIQLKRLQSFLADQFSDTDWTELSMGMSGDFEVAIQEGATIVRVGQAILGPRLKYR